MSIAHLLEDFTVQTEGAPMHLMDDEALEEERLAAFERGYGAGWEDALRAQNEGRAALTEELRTALANISFTYHEALTRMNLSLEPMFESLVRIVLPKAIEQGFAARVVEQLCQMAEGQVAQPVQLVIPPGTAEQVSELLPDDVSPRPKVIEDPGLQPGQARLQVGTARAEVDCAALLETIGAAFDAYVFEARKALSNE
ncbi:putative ABC transporter ATP-binding protein, flagellar [Ruegeria lacuscaerulensis ITI-1157]|nr:putative ABC transporter ATP-binding protein, flagellar [Ruegeria lacuscaerulensis ITI-1157]SHJ63663.1 flagellar assembly protein FliH [Ruegeria lacuscaerulensis ITI-1157]